MRKKEVVKKVNKVNKIHFCLDLLIIFAAIVFVFLLKFPSTLTGLAVYEETILQKNWTFDVSSDYSYDSSLINFSNQQVKLIPQIIINDWTSEEITEAQITSALLSESGHSYDKTVKVNSQDEKFVTLNKNNAWLDVVFSVPLDNGDIISLYVLHSNNVYTPIYLCEENTSCNDSGYGQVMFNESEGWYNITISGLAFPKSTFALDVSHTLKIDYITAVHKDIFQHNSTNISYPVSGVIETKDFSLPDLGSWQTFSKIEELNSQNIIYSYSADSGSTWAVIPENGDLSSVEGNKMRFQARLTSDGMGTSILKGLSVNYVTRQCIENWTCTEWDPEVCGINQTQTRSCIDSNICGSESTKPAIIQSCVYVPPPQVCVENWTVDYGLCQLDDTKLKFYIDNNNCGTIDNLSQDNNTNVSCDYCIPAWQEVNGSCQPDNIFTSRFYDVNNCYALTGLESDDNQPVGSSYDCDYCALDNCTGSFGGSYYFLGDKTWQVNAINETRAYLELVSEQMLENATITLVTYSSNPKSNSSNMPMAVPLNYYVNINSNLSNISSVKIMVYYTEEEINQSNLDENKIQIFYYNETSQIWEGLNSVVNVTDKSVYTFVSHLSLYGLFGQEKESSSPIVNNPVSNSGSGGGGGGGGGSYVVSASSENKKSSEIKQTTALSLKTKTLSSTGTELVPSSEQRCNYELEVLLPEEISLIKEDSSQGEIVNKGNCVIQKLDLSLSSDIAPLVDLPQASFTNIQEGNATNFVLIRKSIKEKKLFDFFTGSAVADLTTPLGLATPKKTNGSLILEGFDEQQSSLFKRNINFTVEVLSVGKTANYLGAGFFSLLFVMFVYLFFRMGKGFVGKKKKVKYRGF